MSTELLRAEFASASGVEERRRAVTVVRLGAANVEDGGSPAVRRRRTNR
jgi:hypothetical protein